LGKDIQEIENASDDDFVEVGRQVKYNIEQALKKHDSEIKDIDEKYGHRFRFGKASLVETGALAFVSAVYPPIALATGVASAATGGRSILKTMSDYVEKRVELEALRKRPVALLFDSRTVR
jgi:hypothetical protein